MKGIILAGGTGSRLDPLTRITNKHLLPVYNKPMIYYPLMSLQKAGIKNVTIVTGKGFAGDFLELLGTGKEFDMRLNYAMQEEAGGIAQALNVASPYASDDKVIVILGDNLFDFDLTQAVEYFKKQEKGSKIFLKEVPDPKRFGVPEIVGDKIVNIEEKPAEPKSNYAVTGLYMYDMQVWDVIKTLKPSGRGELEITDVNNFYIQQGSMSYEILKGDWTDAGTFDSLLNASNLISNKENQAKG